MSVDIVFSDTPEAAAKEAILKGLVAFNTAQAQAADTRTLALLLTDTADAAIVGGLWGRTSWSWLYVELLFIPETLRGAGLGTQLMRQAEGEALNRGCRGVWLDTFSWQARGSYERLGYSVFGTLADFPPGHSRYFLHKPLAAPTVPL
jgi:GNAT superfamily N-acetyltransferase